MKRIIAILMILVMAVSLAGCDDEPITPTNKGPVPEYSVTPGWWPQNDYFKQVPPPPTGVELSDTFNEENSCSVMMTNVTYKMAEEYITKLQNKGFTLDAAPMGYEVMDIYMFSARNAEGYTVEVIYSVGTLSITVRK